VRVKVSRLGDRIVNVAPEYEDCRALAKRMSLAVKDVYAQAVAAFYDSAPSNPD
jgi:uncharacterized protein (DUF111 family)